jgi:hypothetical protein
MQRAAGCAFGRLVGELCRPSEVRGMLFYEPLSFGQSWRVPCAVLIGTADDIPPVTGLGLTLFPRYGGMSVLMNILNRPGVLCLKGEETKARDAVNPDTAD